jgi:hypothetical protein
MNEFHVDEYVYVFTLPAIYYYAYVDSADGTTKYYSQFYTKMQLCNTIEATHNGK